MKVLLRASGKILYLLKKGQSLKDIIQIQMSKDKESICVTVRVRPLSSKQLDEDSRVCLKVDEPANLISLNGEKQAKDFYFDSVCDRISQNEFFERVGRKSTDYCMEGYNCTIFAYGQTGAGKTFTMMGVNPESRDYHDLRGLIPRTLEYLFQSIEKQINELGVQYMIKCSFIEIYNQQIIDLRGNSSTLNIRQDMKKGVYIEGVTEQLISRSDEALEILRKGSKGRHVGSTCYNENSSRSHSVFTMQIDSQKMNNGIKSTKSRHFHFIDLAGSQKTKKINGDRLKQGCSINKSLHVLSTVIGSLGEVSEGKTRHINYRDSKLTFLLKDSLGGNSKTHVIANISPSWVSASETRSTLIFARKVKMIKMNKASINEDSSGNLQSLKAQIKRLKSENIFLRNGTGGSINNSLAVAGSISPSQTNSKMMGVLQQYVDEELDKQTQMQLELAKMKNKNSYLQKGIKHFSENEKQLRMVIAIYEDKIKRLKETEKRLLEQVESLSEKEHMEILKQYFDYERNSLLQEVEKLKTVGSSTGLVKTLLRDLKIVREGGDQGKEDDEAMIKILSRNNEFLQEIKQSIKELEPETKDGKASAAVLKENEEIKTLNEELSEKVEKRNIEIIQMKDKLEETETLLEESIATQISLQKKIAEEVQEREKIEETIEIQKQKSSKALSEAKEQIRVLISKQNELELVISENTIQMSEMKKKLTVLKDKQHFEEVNFKEQIETLHEEKVRLEEVVREKIQEIQKLKNQSIEFKNEIERVEEDLKTKLDEDEKKISQYQEKYRQIETEKSELKLKFDAYKEKAEGKTSQKDHEIIDLNDKILSLKEELRQINHEITKEHKNTNLWKEKHESQARQFEKEKLKWEEHNKEMLVMINEKETSDSETHQKLTQSQLELMESNERINDLKSEMARLEESLSKKEKQFVEKIDQLEQQIKAKQATEKQNQNEIFELRKKFRLSEEESNTQRRKLEGLQEELLEKNSFLNKLNEQMQKLKEKEKQLRINLNEMKNENYAIKKNHEVEIESLRQTITRKDDEIAGQEREHLKIKENLEKMLSETKQMMENEIEVLKENEESIKKALQAHLKNKQTKIVELKEFLDENEHKLSQKEEKIKKLEEDYQEVLCKVASLEEQKVVLAETLAKVQDRITGLEEQLNETQTEHIRVLQDNQNDFTEELDAKNAEIQKLQKQLEIQDETIEKLNEIQEENKSIKTEIQELYEKMQTILQEKENLENELSESKRAYQQSDHQCGHLEAILVERDNKITELEVELSKHVNSAQTSERQQTQIMTEMRKEKERLESLLAEKEQIQAELKQKIEEKINDTNQKELELSLMSSKISQFTSKISVMENDLSQLHHIREELEGQKRKVQEQLSEARNKQEHLLVQIDQIARSQGIYQAEERLPQNHVMSAFEKFKYQMTSLNRQIDQWSQENTQLKQAKESTQLNVTNLQKIISEKDQINMNLSEQYGNISKENHRLSENLSILTQKVAEYTKKICILEQNMNSLQHEISRRDEEIEGLKNNMTLMQEAKSQEIQNLNRLYENLKEEKETLIKQNKIDHENMKNAKVGLQTKIHKLQQNIDHYHEANRKNETHLTVEKERNQELQKYIEQQNTRLIQFSSEKETYRNKLEQSTLKLQQIIHQQEKYKLNTEHEMKALKEELSAITQEATEWKNKMEQLEKDVKMANERSEKYRKEFYKERDSNREFKQLLDNAHCQIDSFKSQAQDKDRLYHQLLDKVSRNDVERKGLLTQDRKISELLQKSRIEVNEYRKKYDDQLKMNNLLKMDIEKKQMDNQIIKEKSEQFAKKNQKIMDDIHIDYIQLEEANKKKQIQNAELKKTIQHSSQKISQLEEQYQQVLQECRNAQRQNEEIKRESLKNGSDDKQLLFINKVKEENKMLRKQLQKAEEELNREKSEILKLRSEKRFGKDGTGEVSHAEHTKKIMEVKYLMKQIDQISKLFPNIDLKDKRVGEQIKFGITDLQRELARIKNQNMELKEELHSKCQKLNILESHKYRTYKDDDDTLSRLRTKINKTASTYEGMRHSKEEDKSILQVKDSNKGNSHWAYNR